MAYWGALPEPTLHRGNSMKKRATDYQREPLAVDTGSKGDRSSGQSFSKQNRYSAHTEDTDSLFASPTASTFRPDGLAPRPPSNQYSAADAAYNRDLIERRKQREARNRDAYDDAPPPAAPEVPRAPPVSYKQPYAGLSPNSYGPPIRSRSGRASDSPNTPNRNGQGEYYPSNGREGQRDTSRRHSKGKEVDRGGADVEQPSRKGSVSEAEAKRRREWAADRSPLQRLELTLDSITKEEKRARVEEAEVLAREGDSGRGPERATSNSVRFRNRPVVKGASDTSQVEVQRNPSHRSPVVQTSPDVRRPSGTVSVPREQHQRAVSTESRPATQSKPRAVADTVRHNNYHPGDENRYKSSAPHREQSVRERGTHPVATGTAAAAGAVAGAAVATGLSRSGSNKLKKDPPGDPWFNRRAEAEKQFQQVSPRDGVSRDHQPPRDHDLPPVSSAKISKETAYPINSLESESDSEEDVEEKPVRRGSSRKIEQLTGVKPTIQSPRAPQSGQEYNNNAKSEKLDRTTSQRVAGEGHRTEQVTVNGIKYAISPTTTPKASQANHRKAQDHHHFSNVLYHSDDDDAMNGQHVYTPSRRLDEWKKGGALLLDGAMLDLDPVSVEQSETDKNKAWWEAGNAGQRRRGSTAKARKAEAYDGEYDDSNAPTSFKPKLFLRSGPMLRYCGMRQEKKQGRVPKDAPRPTREIWRGSVMIVTEDSASSYELAPTLRLFLQPVDLLPPPPAQVHGEAGELAPEYVDPLAGLPKIGRDGRTLYVRPVDHLEEGLDLSREETDDGLFEMHRSPMDGASDAKRVPPHTPNPNYSGEKAGKYKEIRGFRLHAEHGVTFWKFNLEIELRENQQRIAYRINRGPATGFWVPGKNEAMNIMFHSCNGFSYGVDANSFSGPDPMWRDVLNTHQTQPFHVMLGGGDQVYNDCVQHETEIFKEWTKIPIKHQHAKEHHPFTAEMQHELEKFYLNRYSMWFSQGLFGFAVSQIPMVNIFDDHDIIDGFGSYSDRYMKSPVMSGLGAVAFKYYMLFQHQSSIDEGEETEPSWILGSQPGPYIPELSRSIFTFLGRSVAFLGLDCRTERMYDEVVSPETYDKIFARLMSEIKKGETKHLIVLLGVPIAYPRMVWLENILTSRLMEPVKAMSRAGIFGKKLLNHLDGGVEILDDLDDHWTAKHHKDERNFLMEELQELAAEKSVRITILGGDVHLAAIGQFYSNPKLDIPKDHDHRYMPNIISSAIVNTPPPDALADLLNKRNKVHHLDEDTDENMIPIFTHDVNGKPRNNKRLLNRRNWCSIRQYNPELTPPPSPDDGSYGRSPSPPPKRGLLRRLSSSKGPSYRPDAAPTDRPPLSSTNFFARRPSFSGSRRGSVDSQRPGMLTRTLSLTRKDFMPATLFRRNSQRKKDHGGINGYDSETDEEEYYRDPPPPRSGLRGGAGPPDDESYFPSGPRHTARSTSHTLDSVTTSVAGRSPQIARREFHRTPTGLSVKQQLERKGRDVNLEGGLDICLNLEVNPKDPAGITMPYRLLVPQLWYEPEKEGHHAKKMRGGMKRWLVFTKKGGDERWRDDSSSESVDSVERDDGRRDDGRRV